MRNLWVMGSARHRAGDQRIEDMTDETGEDERAPGDNRPLLVFDGDCGLCRDLVAHAEAVSEGAVEFRPFQQLEMPFRDVPLEQFRRTIVLFHSDGRRSQGARAAFEVLATGRGRGNWLRAYERIPGFAPLAERGYRWVAEHRPLVRPPVHWLFGAPPQPVRLEGLARWLTLGIGICLLLAFASLGVQVQGLFGSEGIRPVAQFLARLEVGRDLPELLVPTLLWLDASDRTLWLLCLLGGLAGAAAMICAVRGRSAAAPLLLGWLLYLSLVLVGAPFLTFQWDLLLLEATLLAALLQWHRALGVWALRWLAIRFLFLSGWVKLASGDASWWTLSALEYHFETQPLPGPLSWWAHQLPDGLLAAATATVLALELLLPLALFAPRRLRALAGLVYVAFQLAIVATGNYNFFNLLAMVLALSLLDDRALGIDAATGVRRPGRGLRRLGVAGLILVSTFGLLQAARMMAPELAAGPLRPVLAAGERLHLASGYGLFAVMSQRRDELVIEGSLDGEDWRAYGHRWKPDDPHRQPPQVAPHQPRLDWQLWFAALGRPTDTPWVNRLLIRLSRRSAPVEDLFASIPFAEGEKPRFFRIRRVRYGFTTPAQRERSGRWWSTRDAGLWMRPVQVRSGQR